ncbi:MAG: hypothetical protein EOP37_06285 [Rubrivivax sp.]|nr:MAG: hypothetical protein EOP37_06285 [Rubrivivax sp.]
MLPNTPSPACDSWLGDAWNPGVASGVAYAITPDIAIREADIWHERWQALDWASTELQPVYRIPFRAALRGWGDRLKTLALQLGDRARRGELDGFHQQIDQFKRIQSANSEWLLHSTTSARREAQDLAAEFLLNRNQFFKRYDNGAFDHLARAPQADRDRFNQLIDELETCAQPRQGVQCLSQLETFALKISPTPLRRF